MLEPIKHIKAAAADGANDSDKNFEYSDNRRTLPLIPVHINATGGSLHRKLRVEEQLGGKKARKKRNVIPPKEIRKKNQEKWKSEIGCHMRPIIFKNKRNVCVSIVPVL